MKLVSRTNSVRISQHEARWVSNVAANDFIAVLEAFSLHHRHVPPDCGAWPKFLVRVDFAFWIVDVVCDLMYALSFQLCNAQNIG